MIGEGLWSIWRPFVAAECFKLCRMRVARAAVIAMAVASPLIMGMVWLVGDDRVSTFPHVLELIYLPAWLLGGLVGLLLTVEVMGSEFEQDTVRTVVGRGTPRWLFVGGKAVALLAAVALNEMVCLFSGGAFAVFSHLCQAGTVGLAEGLGELARSGLPALSMVTLSGLAYAGILLLVVVLLRSSALSMLCGLLILGGDFVLVGFEVEGIALGPYSIYRSTLTLLSRVVKIEGMQSWGMPSGGEVASSGQALFTLALYAAVGIGLAYYVFRQRDLVERK